MDFDLFSGFSTLTLKKPLKPIEVESPREICLYSGENEGQNQSFLQVIRDLALAFKFLPDNVDNAFKLTKGTGYQNLDFCPEASEWDLIEGDNINSTDLSSLDDINKYFNWDDIKNIGGSQSYYQIANSTAISSFSDKDAFNFMCSMLESKERVFGALTSIFGPADGLGNDADVIGHITSFLDGFTQVDPHNMNLLNMFFGMQTSFINALDAYMNCQTYWGGDGTSNLLMSKVDSYISTLSDDGQKTAAQNLETKWLTDEPRWDKVGDTFVKDLKNTDGSWVKFFQDKMDDFNNKDICRVVVSNMMNNSANQKYKNEKADYESKKDDLMQEEIFLQKLQAKKAAESKQAFNKLLARKKPAVSRTVKAKNVKSSSLAARAKPAPKPAPKPVAAKPAVKHTPNISAASTLALKKNPVVKAADSNIPLVAHNQNVQAKKYAKNNKKVI